MTNTKTCTKCGQIKTLNEFGNHARHSDSKSSSCLPCDRIRRAETRVRNKDAIKAQQADNYQRNRAKRIQATKVYQSDLINWQKKLESNKRWRNKNHALMASYQRRRRAKMLANGIYTITNKELDALYAKPCIYCGSIYKIEIDHVMPIARGGNHGIGNLAPACINCNRSKRDLFVMEWRLKTISK